MSDDIKHECGVALLRLRKSPSYYTTRYHQKNWGFSKLVLMMEKQHNRGQDGAGFASLSFDAPPGVPFFQCQKSCGRQPLTELIETCCSEPASAIQEGNLFLGHLRYGTFGGRTLACCQPVVNEELMRNRTLIMAGNFNLTNTEEIFNHLVASGHHPTSKQDSTVLMQHLSHHWAHYLEELDRRNIPFEQIIDKLTIEKVFGKALDMCDGGYVLSGMFGHGDAFALRDPAGIRPAYYYMDDEIVVVASERPPIQIAFNLSTEQVKPLPPGKMLIIRKGGKVDLVDCQTPKPQKSCVFERIYFSRGNDAEIHHERRLLGEKLTDRVLKAVDYDLQHTVFSYIPNTAQISFHGLLDGLNNYCRERQLAMLTPAVAADPQLRQALLDLKPRFGQIAVKDAKYRTFITDSEHRLAASRFVYDITYGMITPHEDNLVVIDDSIVRGNTMKNAILRILDRLHPVKIVITSSAPPVCYPDCYGIDMANLGDFVAFEAALNILRDKGLMKLYDDCVEAAREDLLHADCDQINHIQPIYEATTLEELEEEISRLLTPEGIHAKVQVVYQTVDALAQCCPKHRGDWYFTGNYPTPGGNRVANRALVNFADHKSGRAY